MAIELRAKEKSRHHDDEQCHLTLRTRPPARLPTGLPPQNFFSLTQNSKLNQCTITKRKFPPMDDDEMPSSFELAALLHWSKANKQV